MRCGKGCGALGNTTIVFSLCSCLARLKHARPTKPHLGGISLELTPELICKLLGLERLLLERPDKAGHPLTGCRQLRLGGSQLSRLD